jgi:hypothetical protein
VAPLVGKEVRGTSIQENSQTLPEILTISWQLSQRFLTPLDYSIGGRQHQLAT